MDAEPEKLTVDEMMSMYDWAQRATWEKMCQDVVDWCLVSCAPGALVLRPWNKHVRFCRMMEDHYEDRSGIGLRVKTPEQSWKNTRHVNNEEWLFARLTPEVIYREMLLDMLSYVPLELRPLFGVDTRVDVTTSRIVGADMEHLNG